MIFSTFLRIKAAVALAMVSSSLCAQDGFERISTDTIEWNGHRFELAIVRELKDPLWYGVKELVNRKGEEVAVFEPGRMYNTNIHGPGLLIVAGDTIKTLGNRFAQLAKNDSTIIMFSYGRGSLYPQVYNPVAGLKTINSDLSAFYHNPFLLRETDGIYGFGQGYNNECAAVKYTFSGDLVWKTEVNPRLSYIGGKGAVRREGRNIMFNASLHSVGGLENDSVVYALLDAENGRMRCSWTRSDSNPGLGEFKSFVGDDRFICSLGKEWVLYSLGGKCREIKRGKLLDERFLGGVGSFKDGQLLGFASGLTHEVRFIDLKSNKTDVITVIEVAFSTESLFIDKNTILYKSCLRNQPHLIVKLIE